MLMVRDGEGYVVYYYLSDGKYDSTTGEYSAGWADAGGNPLPGTGVEIPAGTAFWFVDQYSDASSLTVPGSVVSDATSDVTFGTGYTLAACPYPKAVAFSEIAFKDLVGPAYDDDGNFFTTAPMLMVRDGEGYVVYYYLSDGKYDSTTGEYSAGWADAGGNPLVDYSEKLISAGTAFWMSLPSGSVTATFSL